jgi:hypothetical protein
MVNHNGDIYRHCHLMTVLVSVLKELNNLADYALCYQFDDHGYVLHLSDFQLPQMIKLYVFSEICGDLCSEWVRRIFTK